MYTLKVKSHFDSAHHLLNYKGPCKNIHGHRWEIVAIYEYKNNNKNGMCVDFQEIKGDLKYTLKDYDHNDLNTFIKQPTAENIVKEIYKRLKILNENLVGVSIFESPECEIFYQELE